MTWPHAKTPIDEGMICNASFSSRSVRRMPHGCCRNAQNKKQVIYNNSRYVIARTNPHLRSYPARYVVSTMLWRQAARRAKLANQMSRPNAASAAHASEAQHAVRLD